MDFISKFFSLVILPSVGILLFMNYLHKRKTKKAAAYFDQTMRSLGAPASLLQTDELYYNAKENDLIVLRADGTWEDSRGAFGPKISTKALQTYGYELIGEL